MAAFVDAARNITLLANGRPIPSKRLNGHSDDVNSVAFFATGERLASGSKDGTIRIWSVVGGGGQSGKVMEHGAEVHAVAVSWDDKLLASGGADRWVVLWDTETCERFLRVEAQHTAAVQSLSFSLDGTRLFSGCAREIAVWDVPNGHRVPGLFGRGHPAKATSPLALSPTGGMIATASEDQEDNIIRIWDITTGGEVAPPINDRRGYVTSIAWSPDGAKVIADPDDVVKSWDARTGEELGVSRELHKRPINHVAVSPNGLFIASASLDGTVRLWNASSHQPVGPSFYHSGPVWSVAISPDNGLIASGDGVGVVYVWHVSGQELTAPSENLDSEALPISTLENTGKTNPEDVVKSDLEGIDGKSAAKGNTASTHSDENKQKSGSVDKNKPEDNNEQNKDRDGQRDRASETSSVRNFLDMAATSAPGPSNAEFYDSFFQQGDIETSRKGKENEATLEEEEAQEPKGRRQNILYKRIKRLQLAFERRREPQANHDIPLEEISRESPLDKETPPARKSEKGKEKETPREEEESRELAGEGRRQKVVSRRIKRLQQAFERHRHAETDYDIPLEEEVTPRGRSPPRPQPRLTLTRVAAGRYKEPVVINKNNRQANKKLRRRSNKTMLYEEWLRLRQERKQSAVASGTTPHGRRPARSSSTGSTSGSSLSWVPEDWETYHTGRSAFWNWLCFKCG